MVFRVSLVLKTDFGGYKKETRFKLNKVRISEDGAYLRVSPLKGGKKLEFNFSDVDAGIAEMYSLFKVSLDGKEEWDEY